LSGPIGVATSPAPQSGQKRIVSGEM